MELIVISSPVTVDKEAQIINRLFEAGLKRLHLRKPDWDSKQLVDLLLQIDPAFFPDIALHQHHHIAGDFDMKRLHYTERHMLNADPEKLTDQNNEGYILSTSVHDFAVLPSLKSFAYVFFGPVFNSISKPGYQSKLSEGFRIDKNTTQPQVIALGGVEVSNLNKVKEMNFDGAAVLGTIWNNPDDAVSTFKKLKHCLIN